jgi:hypothetical protein
MAEAPAPVTEVVPVAGLTDSQFAPSLVAADA